jgi:hypothetical protein
MDDIGRAVVAHPIRDTIGLVLERVDVIEETSKLLDGWAEQSGVVEALTIGQTSFWYYVRLRHWLWLQERVLWAAVLRRLLDEHHPTQVVVDDDADTALLDVARLIATDDGLHLRVETANPRPTPVDGGGSRPRRGLLPRLRALAARVRRSGPPTSAAAARSTAPAHDVVDERLARLAAEDGKRLLVVLTHASQRIETDEGPRFMNPYLGPVIDALRGTRLDPILVDRRARRAGMSASPAETTGADRLLPIDAVRDDDVPVDPGAKARSLEAARAIALVAAPAFTSGIDLGPDLAREVSQSAVRWFPRKHLEIGRMRLMLERLPVAGILVADEYHRQECLEAAAAAGVPVVAIQHGTIYRRHNGYAHSTRPPQLRLPDRTYVFGSWERDLLVGASVYHDDEVVVGGSPRIDLYRHDAVDRDAVRAEYGIEPGMRLLVLSGTYGAVYRRFHYPVALARLFDRPLPNVHLVVKQHPAEADEGPYRAVIEGVAALGGFAPPPITLVQHVDLYRLLAAADAHLGVHSTVLTEAVFVGTPNLLAAGVLGGDLLDYVASEVAVPVVTGADLLEALGTSPGSMTREARAAFIARHFEPGKAATRIADHLLATVR